jgi:hypothetical protein
MATWRIKLFVAAAALLAGAVTAAAQLADLAPAGEGFSVRFPPNPTFHPDVPSRDIVAHSWTAAGGGYLYFMGRGVTKNGRTINGFDSTFDVDQDDVVTAMKATLVKSEHLQWPGPDGPLPARLFAITVGNRYGEYLETIRDKYVFAIFVMATADSPAAREEVDRRVRTLRITQ